MEKQELAIKTNSQEVKDNFGLNGSRDLGKVSLVGRLSDKRTMGKSSLAKITDKLGSIQIYVNRHYLCQGKDKSPYDDLWSNRMNTGDTIKVEGDVFITSKGVITIEVSHLNLLNPVVSLPTTQ